MAKLMMTSRSASRVGLVLPSPPVASIGRSSRVPVVGRRATALAVAAPNRDEVIAQEQARELAALEASLLLSPQESEESLPAQQQQQPLQAGNVLQDAQLQERKQARQREQLTYQFSAIAASIGVTGLAILATYLRFDWHLSSEGEMPWGELLGTLTLVAGGVFGMEMYARFAHKTLWHDFAPGWALHKSHHEPRTGPFEANDIFAIINGVPAMALCLYGFLTPGMTGGLCFGAGLGITLFGIMYMFVHDGLVHRRFPVGPIAELPYLKRVAVAHQLHHAHKYDGAPWGMFLAMQELDGIPGARDEVERLVREMDANKTKAAARSASRLQ